MENRNGAYQCLPQGWPWQKCLLSKAVIHVTCRTQELIPKQGLKRDDNAYLPWLEERVWKFQVRPYSKTKVKLADSTRSYGKEEIEYSAILWNLGHTLTSVNRLFQVKSSRLPDSPHAFQKQLTRPRPTSYLQRLCTSGQAAFITGAKVPNVSKTDKIWI